MIGGSQVASWEVYPRKHADPDTKKQMAGAGSTTGERASLNYGHQMNYTSQMTDDMKLACGHAASRDLVGEAKERKELRQRLSRHSGPVGFKADNLPVDYSQVGSMPNIIWDRDHRSPNMKGDYYHRPRPYRYDDDGVCASRTTMRDCMDGGLDPNGRGAKSPEYKDYDPKELKMKLSRNVHKEGDGHWYGYSKRLSTPPRFPSPRSRREKGSHYVSSIGATLFPSEDRIFGTTMRDCMEGGVHGKKQKAIGAGSKPSYPRIGLEYDYEPFSLEMPSHFEGYKGGRIPGEALLDSAKRDFWKVGRLKSLVKHQDGSSPPASRDGPR